jgi:transposase InsO family protein
VSRAGFYRCLQEKTPVEEDMELRSAIQQIVLEHRRRYGYRRVAAELRRRGMLANHKRVVRIMREDNLLAVQPRQFVVTTDSDHELGVYPMPVGPGAGVDTTRREATAEVIVVSPFQ